MDTTLRLLYLVSHPIQYQAPLLRLIAGQPDIELLVLFEHFDTATTYHDSGFGHDISWDVPLTDGYDHQAIESACHLQALLAKADALWVHGWDSPLKRKAIRYAKKIGVPVLMRGENTDAAMPDGWGPRGIAKRLYLSRIFANCSGFLCIGSDNQSYYEKRGVGAGRLFQMPYTVDNDFFKTRIEAASKDRAAFRKSLGIPENSPVILYAGKLQARKHPLTLLKAFQKLDAEKTGNPYLLYVGDGEQRDQLTSAVKTAGDHVQILGFKNQTELPAFYDLADIFVLASEKEPWGLSINEAMIGGCVPIVTSECGSTRDLIDETRGRVVRPGDADQLADALCDLLRDRARLRAMGLSAQNRLSSWGLQESVDGLRHALTKLKFLSA